MSTTIETPPFAESLAFVSPLQLLSEGADIFALMELEKYCKRCDSMKAAVDFSPHPLTLSRLQAHCKACRRDSTRDASREYARAHPHVGWRSGYRKRCARFGISPVVEDFTRNDLIARDGEQCAMCDVRPSADHMIVLDHVIPVAAGGPHALSNVQFLCGGPAGRSGCNGRKARDSDAAMIAAYRTETV